MKRRIVLLLVVSVLACEGRRADVDPTSALAAPGSAIPPFSFPSIRGWTFSHDDLLKGHTLVAIVPAAATGDEPELVDFDSLKSKNPMFRFAVIYDRGVESRDTAYLNEPLWLMAAQRGFATDSAIVATFGAGAQGAPRSQRARLTLPSFLLISDQGRVVARVAGRPLATIGPALDSLRAIWDSARTASGLALIARIKARIEHGVQSFDPATLVDSSVRLSLSGTSGGEETVRRAIIPALANLVDIDARHPGVTATVRIISIAEVAPVDDDDVCRDAHVRVTPKLATRLYDVELFENLPDSSGIGEIYTDFSITPHGEGREQGSLALLPLAESGRRLQPPRGVTIQNLRARIDSIRAATR